MEAIEIRARAARELVGRGVLDGLDALALIVWPPPEAEAASAEVAAKGSDGFAERRDRALELVAAGWSQSAAAREVGISKASVGEALRRRGFQLGRR